MLACSMWALNSYRHMTGITAGRGLAKERRAGRGSRAGRGGRGGRAGRGGRVGKAPSASMMERLEERWRRRQERDR
jgi:hypothetical protein